MPDLFNKLDPPDFADFDAKRAWAMCKDWERWAYDNAESFSEEGWDDVVHTICTNYARYYERYENDD